MYFKFWDGCFRTLLYSMLASIIRTLLKVHPKKFILTKQTLCSLFPPIAATAKSRRVTLTRWPLCASTLHIHLPEVGGAALPPGLPLTTGDALDTYPTWSVNCRGELLLHLPCGLWTTVKWTAIFNAWVRKSYWNLLTTLLHSEKKGTETVPLGYYCYK